VTDTAKPAETTDAKKKRKKRFPSVGEFKTKREYLEAMVKIWQDKLEHFKKFGDGEKAKKQKKGKKVLDQLEALLKDPDCADLVMEARKKLAGKGAPAAPVKT
jgi:hypothetical protein